MRAAVRILFAGAFLWNPPARPSLTLPIGADELAQHQNFILHMSRCSPCYNDFARFRKPAHRQRRLRAVGIAAIIVIIFFASWYAVKSRRHTVGTYTAAVLDLRNRLVLRGVPETGEQAQQPLMLLRGIDNVSLYLPTGSRTGTYDVAVFEVPGKALVMASGTASVQSGLTVLKAKLDISKMNQGATCWEYDRRASIGAITRWQ